MARRSPMNERYQKNTGPSGKTRKSAAAAKPKRAAGSSSSTSSSKKSGGRTPSGRALPVNPDTPEFRLWRRIWWVCLGASIVFAIAAWWLWRDPDLRQYGTYVLVASYTFIGAALVLDLYKLRPMRKAWLESGGKPAKLPKDAQGDNAVNTGTETTEQSDDTSAENKS